MKKLMLLMFFAVSVFSLSATNANSSVAMPEEVLVPEDGVRCKVYNDDGGLIASCWFCNCGKLAEGAR